MQITELAGFEWAGEEGIASFKEDRLFNPTVNVRAGTWYLGKLMRRYLHTDNPVPYALADYNAGRSSVLRWNKGPASTNSEDFIEQITFPGTQRYVREVMERYKQYRGELAWR